MNTQVDLRRGLEVEEPPRRLRGDAKARLRAEIEAGEFAEANAAAKRAESRAGVMGRGLEGIRDPRAVEVEGVALGDDGEPVRDAIFDIARSLELAVLGCKHTYPNFNMLLKL
ncbi:MAG TPA: hypothetical protein VMJ31_07160 [Methylocystis sp.]|nr:hypothetical protein [Methylocystis sp.]